MGRKGGQPSFINSDRIRALLKERGLTQRALAVAIGYSDESSICRSLRRRIVENDLIIIKFADYRGVDPTDITDNYEVPHVNLKDLSSEQLQNICKACNEILEKRLKEKETEEHKEKEAKYKYSLHKGITKEIKEIERTIVERKSVFVTSDGTKFDTKMEAILHENKEKNREIYSQLNKLNPTKGNETVWCYCSTKEEFNAFKQIWAEKRPFKHNNRINESIYAASFSGPDWYCFAEVNGRWKQIRLSKEKENYEKLFKRFENNI